MVKLGRYKTVPTYWEDGHYINPRTRIFIHKNNPQVATVVKDGTLVYLINEKWVRKHEKGA